MGTVPTYNTSMPFFCGTRSHIFLPDFCMIRVGFWSLTTRLSTRERLVKKFQDLLKGQFTVASSLHVQKEYPHPFKKSKTCHFCSFCPVDFPFEWFLFVFDHWSGRKENKDESRIGKQDFFEGFLTDNQSTVVVVVVGTTKDLKKGNSRLYLRLFGSPSSPSLFESGSFREWSLFGIGGGGGGKYDCPNVQKDKEEEHSHTSMHCADASSRKLDKISRAATNGGVEALFFKSDVRFYLEIWWRRNKWEAKKTLIHPLLCVQDRTKVHLHKNTFWPTTSVMGWWCSRFCTFQIFFPDETHWTKYSLFLLSSFLPGESPKTPREKKILAA